jgi:hypothetical protein
VNLVLQKGTAGALGIRFQLGIVGAKAIQVLTNQAVANGSPRASIDDFGSD